MKSPSHDTGGAVVVATMYWKPMLQWWNWTFGQRAAMPLLFSGGEIRCHSRLGGEGNCRRTVANLMKRIAARDYDYRTRPIEVPNGES